MLNYIIRRLALIVPTLIGMTLVLFVVVRFAPGLTTGGGAFGAGGELRNQQARAKAEEAMKKRLHLVDAHGHRISIPMQYVYWLGDTLQGNFGDSIQYDTPVVNLLRDRLPITLTLNLFSSILVYLIAIPGGMLAAVRRARTFDVGWGLGTLALYSLPIIWVGNMMIGFLANPRFLGWFPSAGVHASDTQWMTAFQYASDYFWHLTLPVLCLSYGSFAYLSKIMRGSMLDNLGMDYVRTARAKGQRGSVVVLRHVFRNSLLPMITIFGGFIPGLLGGSVVVEHIFSIKGMGDLFITAVAGRDLPIVQAIAFIGSLISLVCLLLTDIAYAIADPRVSYE
jgi:ABC-type dipeptide/oligopeptide/nickel transport system permease component